MLVGFLGFLGCSGSDDGTLAVGQAIPVAPFGIIETSRPTYEWTPVPWATKYRLLVQDTNQATTDQDSNETSIIDEWYTVEEAVCDSDYGLCMVTPDIAVFEEYTWKVLACANQECGVWSESLYFAESPPTYPPRISRFTDNGDGTVTDYLNPNLTWTKNVYSSFGDPVPFDKAWYYCGNLTLANKSDWRLPELKELRSLIDKRYKDPAIAPIIPFTNLINDFYWTATKISCYAKDYCWVYSVYFGNGQVDMDDSVNNPSYALCVRGP